jgi:beta-glucosidase
VNSRTRIAVLDGNDIDAAVAAASRAQVAIVMVGDQDSEGRDQGLELPAAQNQLVAAVAKANPKTIVVLKSGSAILMPWLNDVPAVLEAWYPGEEDGNAVADVLVGKVNPSGKLPLTFPRSVSDTLAANPDQYPGVGGTVHYSEGLDVGYRAYAAHSTKPLFHAVQFRRPQGQPATGQRQRHRKLPRNQHRKTRGGRSSAVVPRLPAHRRGQ